MAKPKKRKPEPKPQYNLEIIITLGLFLAFIIYGAGQCNKAKVTKDFEDVEPIALANDVAAASTSKESSRANSSENSKKDSSKSATKTAVNLPQLAQKYVNKDSLRAILAGEKYPKVVTAPSSLQTNGATQNSSVQQNSLASQSRSPQSTIASQTDIASQADINPSLRDMMARYNRLWVTIDQLKLRTKPSLNSDVLMRLSLFDRVFFLEEETEFKDEINLGKVVVNEPWFLVQHSNGKKGWVYGAGVNFKKEKNTGVLD